MGTVQSTRSSRRNDTSAEAAKFFQGVPALQDGLAARHWYSARFEIPLGLAVDSAKNVFVADTYNNTIRKIPASTLVRTLAGSAGVTGSAHGAGTEPVTFRYKQELDPDGIPQFGLIAEQVEKLNPDLVVRDEDGKVTTVRYQAVNAMLLNEFLKERRKVEEQERKAQQQDARLAKQEATIARQQQQIEALTATIQKVSDQVALSKPAPQLVANP